MELSKWLDKYWYLYLFEKPFNLTKLWCRIRNHPEGIWWYNPNGYEPDMHCKNCNDNLG